MFLLKLILFSSFCVWYSRGVVMYPISEDIDEYFTQNAESEDEMKIKLRGTKYAREFLIKTPLNDIGLFESKDKVLVARLNIACPKMTGSGFSKITFGPLWLHDKHPMSKIPGLVKYDEDKATAVYRYFMPNQGTIDECWAPISYEDEGIVSVAEVCRPSKTHTCPGENKEIYSSKVTLSGLKPIGKLTNADKAIIKDTKLTLNEQDEVLSFSISMSWLNSAGNVTLNDGKDAVCEPKATILLYESGSKSSSTSIRPVLAKIETIIKDNKIIDKQEFSFKLTEGAQYFRQQLEFLFYKESLSYYNDWSESGGLSVALTFCTCLEDNKKCHDYVHDTVSIGPKVISD